MTRWKATNLATSAGGQINFSRARLWCLVEPSIVRSIASDLRSQLKGVDNLASWRLRPSLEVAYRVMQVGMTGFDGRQLLRVVRPKTRMMFSC